MKLSIFNTIIPYKNKQALYNSFENKVLFIDDELKNLLIAAKVENIKNLYNIHPTFYQYLRNERFIIDSETNEIQKVKDLSNSIDNNPEVFILTINPTMNCNFKCWYCYETHIKDSRLEENVLDSIKKFITKTTKKESIKHFTLSFFGGEPLLYFNKNVIPLIDHLEEECLKTKTSFHISFTTNGYLIDDLFIYYFVKKNISPSLQITFDGYAAEHDSVRFVSKTRGSYDQIVSNIKKLLYKDIFHIRARVNYTNKNIHNCFKIANSFIDLSDKDKNKLLFDFHRVWQDDKIDDTSSILNENIKILNRNGFRTSIIYLPNNVKAPCYADKRNSVTVNYNGDIYKCTARDFISANRLGYITQNGDLIWKNNDLENRMHAKFKNKPCLECKILPLCNGGCSQHAVEHLAIGDEYCVYHGEESEKDKVILSKIDQIINS